MPSEAMLNKPRYILLGIFSRPGSKTFYVHTRGIGSDYTFRVRVDGEVSGQGISPQARSKHGEPATVMLTTCQLREVLTVLKTRRPEIGSKFGLAVESLDSAEAAEWDEGLRERQEEEGRVNATPEPRPHFRARIRLSGKARRVEHR